MTNCSRKVSALVLTTDNKAEMTKQKTRLEDQASEGLLVWSDTEEESSSAPLLDFTGIFLRCGR